MSKSQVTSSLRKVTRMILISTAIIRGVGFYIIYISRMGQTYISRLWKDYR